MCFCLVLQHTGPCTDFTQINHYDIQLYTGRLYKDCIDWGCPCAVSGKAARQYSRTTLSTRLQFTPHCPAGTATGKCTAEIRTCEGQEPKCLGPFANHVTSAQSHTQTTHAPPSRKPHVVVCCYSSRNWRLRWSTERQTTVDGRRLTRRTRHQTGLRLRSQECEESSVHRAHSPQTTVLMCSCNDE